MSQPCVGQIGVGAVGYHFASHLLTKLGDLKVHDIDASRIDRVQRVRLRLRRWPDGFVATP